MQDLVPTQESVDVLIERYEKIRRQAYEAAVRNNGALMGSDKWLVHALQEEDLNLSAGNLALVCSGVTFTHQTMQNEYFSFQIPYTELRN